MSSSPRPFQVGPLPASGDAPVTAGGSGAATADELRHRSPRQVLEDHLALRRAGRLEEDLERNYDPEVILLSLTGGRHGLDGVREMASELRRDCAGHDYRYDEVLINGNVGMLVWSATCPEGAIRDGSDSYLVRDGRIVVQTVHYHVRTS